MKYNPPKPIENHAIRDALALCEHLLEKLPEGNYSLEYRKTIAAAEEIRRLEQHRADLLEACKASLRATTCVSRNEQAPQGLCDCYACEVAKQLQAAISNQPYNPQNHE